MSTNGLSRTVAWRLLRATPGRAALIALTIAVPTGFAVAALAAEWTGAFGASLAALIITTAVVVVAQSSDEPTSVSSVHAWLAAGADAFTATRSRRDAMRMLGWGSVAVGAIVGVVVGASSTASAQWRGVAVLVVTQGLIVFAGAAVAWRPARPARREPRIPKELRLVLASGTAVVLVLLAALMSSGVTSDFDAYFLIPLAAGLVGVAVILALPVLRWLIFAVLGLVRPSRGVAVLAARHPSRLLVRIVVVVSFVVAAVAATLGSSVAARDREIPQVVADVNSLPRVPANVMALRYPEPGLPTSVPTPPATFPPPPEFTDAQVAELQARFPNSVVVPVHQLVPIGANFLETRCWLQPQCEPLVVADPRLDDLYGFEPLATESINYGWDEGSDQPIAIQASRSVPRAEDLLSLRREDAVLPAATWSDLSFMQVNASDVERTPTPIAVRTVFLRQAEPYTDADRRALAGFAAEQAGFVQPTAVTSADRSTDFARRSIGTAPWAPVDPSMRWSIVLIAAVLALMAVVGTSSIVAVDRWRDNERLEVLGASPAQLRVAAALHSWVDLGLAGVLTVGLTVLLVANGVQQFNRQADVQVPFTAPWSQLVFLVVVIPLAAMTVAALVARPLHVRTRGAAGFATTR